MKFQTVQSLTGNQSMVGRSILNGLIASMGEAQGSLTVLDDRSDPRRAAELFDSREGPGALLLAPGSSNCAHAVFDTGRVNVTSVLTSASGISSSSSPHPVFQVGIAPQQIAEAMADHLFAVGLPTLIVVNRNKIGLHAGAVRMRERLLSLGATSVDWVEVDESPALIPNLRTRFRGALRAVALWLGGTAAVDVTAMARSHDWEVVLPNTADTTEFLAPSSGTSGAIIVTHTPSLDDLNNEMRHQVDAMRDRLGPRPNAFAVNGYAAMQVALELYAQGVSTQSKVRVSSVFGELKYTADGARLTVPQPVLGRVDDGKLLICGLGTRTASA